MRHCVLSFSAFGFRPRKSKNWIDPTFTMEAEAGVSLMIMYEDESVDVRYGNGSQLQLSPCGCEFLLVKAADPSGHQLQPSERVRQRTRFTISAYREVIEAALTFRNKYASRPYLPEALIPAECKKPFFSTDTDVQWPERSNCEAELRPRGEVIVRSEEGRAVLMLSPSGEEFSIEFTCSLSQTETQHHSRDPDGRLATQQHVSNPINSSTNNKTEEVHRGKGRSGSPVMTCTSQPKPEETYQSTTVIQHHSCCAYDSTWSYPLSLARHHRTARLSQPKVVGAEGAGDSDPADMSDVSNKERRSHLPQALPLTCPSPHRHRWKFKDPLTKTDQLEQDLPAELVKVMWCQGVTYRILSGAVTVIEVSPGDGSVMRSNGVLNTYFTHHKPDHQSGQVKEVSYYLNSLPPDVLGQDYSVGSIVSRASRILTSYDQAKQSLKLSLTPSCLQEGRDFFKLLMHEEENLSNPAPSEHHMNLTQTVASRSDLVAAELEKIKRFNFLLENSCLQQREKGNVELCGFFAEEEKTGEPVSHSSIAEALQRTSKAIQDIDALMSATTLT